MTMAILCLVLSLLDVIKTVNSATASSCFIFHRGGYVHLEMSSNREEVTVCYMHFHRDGFRSCNTGMPFIMIHLRFHNGIALSMWFTPRTDPVYRFVVANIFSRTMSSIPTQSDAGANDTHFDDTNHVMVTHVDNSYGINMRHIHVMAWSRHDVSPTWLQGVRDLFVSDYRQLQPVSARIDGLDTIELIE